ncbi:protein kinase family protein [Nisaea nitritireducens]|uniref:hypothetical protein n=1 Tax=Nisaea nitritireducens TaxID=568392 RepID=UPI001868E710|nr:hypothetical protein [Nisaea nitritireducens]
MPSLFNYRGMKKETIEQIGFLGLTVVGLTISIMVFVPGAYGPISEFFGKFGGFLGAAAGVISAYFIAVWQIGRHRHDHRTVVAHSVGLPLADLFYELRKDIEEITLIFMKTADKFRVAGYIQEWQTNKEKTVPPFDGSELRGWCHARLRLYREREEFWSGRNNISELEYEDYFRLYLIYKKLDFIISQHQENPTNPVGSVPKMFALTLQNFIDIEENTIAVLDSLRCKYALDLPHVSRRPPPHG